MIPIYLQNFNQNRKEKQKEIKGGEEERKKGKGGKNEQKGKREKKKEGRKYNIISSYFCLRSKILGNYKKHVTSSTS